MRKVMWDHVFLRSPYFTTLFWHCIIWTEREREWEREGATQTLTRAAHDTHDGVVCMRNQIMLVNPSDGNTQNTL